ncbi:MULTISPECIES: helix-turn-helix transcriptional regulator [unclassified Halomonas]|uniref:helix-turn-helix domain-containing protein n=1 Tax=unclassified Halomonas TaxID=2609666 RepID=UPI0020A0C419|nr:MULTISPECIES: helix-turn-helix transcriptional regulator [unclassified Halomonas]MCP1313006.1 helix-turn-helix transcriptional regulator [Halomonas sp. 707D7]MCP1326094.1 helix-turn-helix transcriptional regulator [Halomonas sp. 707D4]
MDLTPRQSEIIVLLANGHTADQCAAILHRSVATVQRHILLAKGRLHARNTTHLVALALAQKLIQLVIVCALMITAISPDAPALRHRQPTRTRTAHSLTRLSAPRAAGGVSA